MLLEGILRNHLLSAINALQQNPHERLAIKRLHHQTIREDIPLLIVDEKLCAILQLVDCALGGKEGRPGLAVSFGVAHIDREVGPSAGKELWLREV
jgi:hypothetical protein